MTKLRTKKIIAREFLILISSIGLSLICYFGTFPYNAHIRSQVKKTENKLEPKEQRIDSLLYSYNRKIAKQKWFFRENAKRYDLVDAEYNDYEKLWERLSRIQETDSIVYRWDNVWPEGPKNLFKEIGFKNGQEFNEFIQLYSLTAQDKKNKEQADNLRLEARSLHNTKDILNSRILDSELQQDFFWLCLVIILSVVYPLRFMVLAIKWSILTLKQNE